MVPSVQLQHSDDMCSIFTCNAILMHILYIDAILIHIFNKEGEDEKGGGEREKEEK